LTVCIAHFQLPSSKRRDCALQEEELHLARFDLYLREIQCYLGLEARDLIREWTTEEIDSVIEGLCAAIDSSGVIGSSIGNFGGTNQSKGNRAADHFVAVVPQHLPGNHKIMAAAGAGYPDRIYQLEGVGFCMEMKATSNWQGTDSNRRVLTSSPAKMLDLTETGSLDNPPPHLICTVMYTDQGVVSGLRLDFLEPDSEINIRLEASTSQKLLTQGGHTVKILH
jgi:hypothetical protein